MSNPTQETIINALKAIIVPEKNMDPISAELVVGMAVEDGRVKIKVNPKDLNREQKIALEDRIRDTVTALEGVKDVMVVSSRAVDDPPPPPPEKEEPKQQQKTAPKQEPDPQREIPGVKHILAVASGKGGVGKSTVAVNLAAALVNQKLRVGLLDADIYGPSAPTMLNIHGQMYTDQEQRFIPMNRYGMSIISIGFAIDPEQPMIWRGPLVHKMVQQFLFGVLWGELDVLVVDLPPGTGDTQLTLIQSVPLTGAIIVTTPQDVALIDARKGLEMFKQAEVPVLGILENMSYFVCPHCNERSEIFASGGAQRTAEKTETQVLGEIPLDPAIREGGDTGTPFVISHPDSVSAKVFEGLAKSLTANLKR